MSDDPLSPVIWSQLTPDTRSEVLAQRMQALNGKIAAQQPILEDLQQFVKEARAERLLVHATAAHREARAGRRQSALLLLVSSAAPALLAILLTQPHVPGVVVLVAGTGMALIILIGFALILVKS